MDASRCSTCIVAAAAGILFVAPFPALLLLGALGLPTDDSYHGGCHEALPKDLVLSARRL